MRRNTLRLALSQACVGAANQLVPTLGGLLVVRLSGSPALAGVATAILGGSRFLVAYPVGQLSERYGRRAGLVLGSLLCLVGSVSIGASPAVGSFAIFVVGQVLLGLGLGASQQLRLAAADMYPPVQRGHGLGPDPHRLTAWRRLPPASRPRPARRTRSSGPWPPEPFRPGHEAYAQKPRGRAPSTN